MSSGKGYGAHRGLSLMALAGAAVSVAAQAALASPTPIPTDTVIGDAIFTGRNFVDTPRDGEKTHKQILDLLYGGDFTPVGLDFTNGTYYIQRIPDALAPSAGVSAARIGEASISSTPSIYDYADQEWYGNFSNVTARYRFADYEQSFGYSLTGSGLIDDPDYNKLLDITWQNYGPGYSPLNEVAVMPNLDGEVFNWVRGRDNGLFSSDPSRNRDGLDHLITYKVILLDQGPKKVAFSMASSITDGEGGGNAKEVPISEVPPPTGEEKTFLLFWEDQMEDGNVHWYDDGDWDYNDLVVEIRGIYNSHEVPEPSSLALAGLGGLALLRRRRRA